jgi:hypothetical protein
MKKSITAAVLAKIRGTILHHEKFSKSYFWRPPLSAAERRRMEDKNSFQVEFQLDGDSYIYDSSVRCSCRRVRYTGSFRKNSVPGTVRLFKSLLEN